MSVFWVVVSLFHVFLLGFVMFKFLTSLGGVKIENAALWVSFSVLIGLFCTSLVFFVLKYFSLLNILLHVEAALDMFCFAFLLYSKKWFWRGEYIKISTLKQPYTWLEVLLTYTLVVSLVVSLVYYFFRASNHPFNHIYYDSWNVWIARAYTLFSDCDNWKIMFHYLSPNHGYPLFLSASIARIWTYAGYDMHAVPSIISSLCLISFILLLYGALRVLKSRLVALVAMSVLANCNLMFDLSYAVYSDVPIGLAMLAGVVVLYFYYHYNIVNPIFAIFLGFMAACPVWIKREGLVFFLSFSFVYILLNKAIYKKHHQNLLYFCLGGLPAFVGYFLIRTLVVKNPSSHTFGYYKLQFLDEYIKVLDGYFNFLNHYETYMRSASIWFYFVILLFVVVYSKKYFTKESLLFIIFLITSFVAMSIVFLTNEIETTENMFTYAFDRYYIQQYGVIIFLLFMCIDTKLINKAYL